MAIFFFFSLNQADSARRVKETAYNLLRTSHHLICNAVKVDDLIRGHLPFQIY